MRKNLYQILDVVPTSDDAVIRGVYVALMKKYHPDTFGGDNAVAEAKAKEINAAYQILRDPRKRAAYDARRQRAEIRSKSRTAQNGFMHADNNAASARDDDNASVDGGNFIRSFVIMVLILLVVLTVIGLGVRHY